MAKEFSFEEIAEIKKLMDLLEKSRLQKIHIKKGENFELLLEKEAQERVVSHLPAAEAISFKNESEHHRETSSLKKEKNTQEITSPMIGTFYSAPSPDQPPFVKRGDTVTEDSVICIIEAMKVMNEVKAQTTGVIEEVLVEDGQPVEFGTKLFRINKSL